MLNLNAMYSEYDMYGCAYNCPFQNRLNDCPFAQVDQYSFKQKIAWVEGLGIENTESIIEHHRKCVDKRELKSRFKIKR